MDTNRKPLPWPGPVAVTRLRQEPGSPAIPLMPPFVAGREGAGLHRAAMAPALPAAAEAAGTAGTDTAPVVTPTEAPRQPEVPRAAESWPELPVADDAVDPWDSAEEDDAFPLDAFIIPDEATRVPTGLHLDAADAAERLAHRLEDLARQVRAGGLDALQQAAPHDEIARAVEAALGPRHHDPA